MKNFIAFVLTLFCVSAMAAETNDPNYFEGYPTLTKVRQHYASTVTNENDWTWWQLFNQHPELKEPYVEELMAYVRKYMTTTNVFPRELLYKPLLFEIKYSQKYDEELASFGARSSSFWWYVRFPKVMENEINTWTNKSALQSVYIGLVRSQTNTGYKGIPLPIMANYYACALAEGKFIHIHMFSYNKNLLKKANGFEVIRNKLSSLATTEIKHKLRIDKQNGIGNGFLVGQDGVNPVEGPAKAFIAALQAPKCAGLKEWLAVYFPNYKWIEPEWKSDEEIEVIKNAIYWGDKQFGLKNKMILSGHLGLDGFNEFVKKYND